MMYVDTLNANEVVRYGLGAMLNSLDPYTVYYPADDTKELDLMLTGRYGGIGAIIRYDLVRKTVVIDEPYEDTPAAKAGLRKGRRHREHRRLHDDGEARGLRLQPPARRRGIDVRDQDHAPLDGQDLPQDHHPRADPAACRGLLRRAAGRHRLSLPHLLHGELRPRREARRARHEAPRHEEPRPRPAGQRWRKRPGGHLHRQHVRAQGRDHPDDEGQDQAGQPRVYDQGGADRHRDAHRRPRQRPDGLGLGDHLRQPPGPRPRRRHGHAHLRQGTGAIDLRPALQRRHQAHHEQILHPQRTLHPGPSTTATGAEATRSTSPTR